MNGYWSTQAEDAVCFNDWSSRILKDQPKIEGISFGQWQKLGRETC